MPRRHLPAVLIGRLLLVLAVPALAVPALALPALASAAPATVNLRIEGRTSTLYEGTVTTDIRTIDVNDGTGSHTCDGTNLGANPSPGPTRGAAFAAAAAGLGSAPGFAYSGLWSAAFEDVTFSSVAGQDVNFDPATGAFLGEFKNGVGSFVGSCQDLVADGDRVLYAYAPFGAPVLELTGPGRVVPGAVATLTVTNAELGTPVAGADVGGQATAADGTAQVTIAARGPAAFKATKDGAIRSNRVVVCATDGSDGACGTSLPGTAGAGAQTQTPAACVTNGRDGRCGTRDRIAPGITISGIGDGQRFARGKGPRRIRATVDVEPSGVLQTKLRLTRSDRGRCTYFSGKSERFRPSRGGRCSASAGYWFAVGDKPQIDYLLPSALPRGRYVLDVNVIDKAYNRDDARRRGANRIVFHVR